MNGKKKIYLALALFLSVVLVFGIWFIFDNKGNTLNDNDNYNYYIAAFIDGESSTTFPTSADYITEVVCKKNDNTLLSINATASWTGTKWKLSIKDASYANIYCNVNFITKTTWESPGEGTLLAAIKRDNTVGTPLTTPGRAKTADNEAVLASTEDDYGTSYYFRGAVTNNYVEFANKCWRIVRVEGSDSIKLVLHNDNTSAAASPCNVTGNDYAFARFEGDTYESSFDSNDYPDNAYVGFMYGEDGSRSYEEAHANKNPSTILTNINKWYTNVLSKQANFNDSQLADTIWCNDKSVVTDTTFNPKSLTLGTNYGYAKNKNYYSTAKRLVQTSSWIKGGTGPSLICPNDNNGGKLSKFTVSDTEYGNGALSGYGKIGLLTADEVVFAGSTLYGFNLAYLSVFSSSGDWWTLSPSYYDGKSTVWSVYGDDGGLAGNSVDYYEGVIRPALSLVSTTKVTGLGTATNPYKIVS